MLLSVSFICSLVTAALAGKFPFFFLNIAKLMNAVGLCSVPVFDIDHLDTELYVCRFQYTDTGKNSLRPEFGRMSQP